MSGTAVRRMVGLATITASLLASTVQADVSIIVSAANLQDENGAWETTGCIALLVADTGGVGFSSNLAGTASLTPGSFVSPGNLIVARWDLSSLSKPGQLLNITNLVLGAPLATGKALALFWFPGRTSAATIAGYSHYGLYTNGGIDGGDPWVIPADGSVIQLNFYTASRGGSNPESAGRATNGALDFPDPSHYPSQVTLDTQGTNTILTFTSFPDLFYDVLSTTDLVSGTWSIIATNLSGTGGTISNNDVGAATGPQRFYRVHVQ